MTEIPANCVLSKGITGCGATTLGIEQKGHTLIAMPFTGLIDNKTAQYRDTLLGIYGRGGKEYEIEQYLKSHDTVKIATTFDSLRHVLFNAYDYRYEGVRKLLDTAPHFDRVTYISATPIERKYYLEELKRLPEYRIE